MSGSPWGSRSSRGTYAIAYRDDIEGVIKAPIQVFWNIVKK